jgi:PKD repeat protein
MNRIVKWIMITSICTIFALDCIVLLSVKADAVAVCQKPVANFTSNVTSDCTKLDFQFTDQPTNYSTSWFRDSGGSGTDSIENSAYKCEFGKYS